MDGAIFYLLFLVFRVIDRLPKGKESLWKFKY
nr:MAG TPA: hypothetical protein [Caudoviricetes sp.]